MKKAPAMWYRTWIPLVAAAILGLTGVSKSAADDPVLKELAGQRGIRVRSVVAEIAALEDATFGTAVRTQFHAVTPELSFLFNNIHPEKDTFQFELTDRLVDMAQAVGLDMHGHSLVWHLNLPDWLLFGDWTREEAMAILENHIKTIVGRYKGRIRSWDVINEAVTPFGNLRNTFWLRSIGPEYLYLSFLWAHEADPDALLFYKDFGVAGSKAATVRELVSWFQDYDIPIHGINMQIHAWLNLEVENLMFNIVASMNLLSDLGVQLNLVEVEVPIEAPVTEEELYQQADVYRRLMQLCLCSPKCSEVEFFGFTDKYSWISLLFPGWDAALLADENYLPKPAFYAVADELGQFNDDDGDGIPNDSGSCTYMVNPCTNGTNTGCFDNCPDRANADQADRDGDGQGNVCDMGPIDLNADGEVDLVDAIIAIQVLSGQFPATLRQDFASSGADLNGNGRIDLEEAMIILELFSGRRQ